MYRQRTNFIGLLVPGGLAAYGAWYFRHAWETEFWQVPALLTLYAGLAAISLLFGVLGTLPRIFSHLRARRVTGKGGTAGWAKPKDLRKANLFRKTRGFFVALTLHGKAIFLQIESAGLVLSPSGGGKTVNFVIPALAHNNMSMIVPDLKGTLACMTAALRRRRHKHQTFIWNPSGRYAEIVGPSARYNPLQLIRDAWDNPAQRRRVLALAKGMALQMYPEPPGRKSENEYFRSASRKLLVFAFLYLVTMSAERTLSASYVLLRSRQRVIDAIEMARSSQYLDGDLAGLAEELATKLAKADPRQIESFFEGAVQVLDIYAPSGPLAEATSACDFRFADLRKQKATVYLLGDPTLQDVYKPCIALLFWCAKTELVQAQEGEKVCFLIDEATNFRIEGLPSLLTIAREFGIVIWLVVQELEEWASVYGRESLETLLSQTEAKIIFGVRSHTTCRLVSDMLGDTSIVTPGRNIGVDIFDAVSSSLSESSRRLMTPDEVRRCEGAIIFVRGLKPIRGKLCGYHEAKPWVDWVGVNPLFGKRFAGKVRMRVRY